MKSSTQRRKWKYMRGLQNPGKGIPGAGGRCGLWEVGNFMCRYWYDSSFTLTLDIFM
jgi:hypothetical protein